MSLVVPQTHVARPHYDAIANLKSLIAANLNPVQTNALKYELVQRQRQLVDSLMDSGALCPSAILSTMAFNAADTNS